MYYSSSSDAFSNMMGSLFGLGFASFSFLWICMYCVFGLLCLAGLVLWVWMLIDAAKREDKDFPDKGDNQKLIWILVLILGGWIGAIVYYFVIYKKMKEASSGVKKTVVESTKKK